MSPIQTVSTACDIEITDLCEFSKTQSYSINVITDYLNMLSSHTIQWHALTILYMYILNFMVYYLKAIVDTHVMELEV